MTDRELLELAAKAAGIVGEWSDTYGSITVDDVRVLGFHLWNPLTDDGDALRLAVSLDLCLTPYPVYARPKHSVCCAQRRETPHDPDDRDLGDVIEHFGSDKHAATRRAIVRAAAAIGASK